MDDNTQDQNTINNTQAQQPAEDQPVAQEPQTSPAEEPTQAEPTSTEDGNQSEQKDTEVTENPVPIEAESPTEHATPKSAEESVPSDTTEVIHDVDEATEALTSTVNDVPGARWYVVHTYSGHENRVATTLKQRVESEHLENKILDILVPTQEKIEIRSGKKETVKEKIFPGYILVKMVLDDSSWLAVRTTQGVTAFIGMGQKPTPISEAEVKSIVNFMSQGGQPTYKQIFIEGDTVKIVDGPFAEFIGKVDSVDKERGKVKVLVSIFGRETPVELDFLQVNKL